MGLTHSIGRSLKTIVPVIGSAGMLFTLYQWMVGQKGQTVEEMECIQIQEWELLRDLWNHYDVHRSVYQICDDYLDNDMTTASQIIDTLKERLTDCQSLLRPNKLFIRRSVWDAYDGLLKTHNHFAEVVMWEMCGPEGMNVFLRDSRSDIYKSEILLTELLRG